MPHRDPALRAIGQIAICVRDLRRATSFYRDVLGLPLLFEAEGLAFFACGGVRLMLSCAEQDELQPPGSILYYRVDDIANTYWALEQRGVRFERAPHPVHRAADHVLWLAELRDSEGNLLALMSEVPAG